MTRKRSPTLEDVLRALRSRPPRGKQPGAISFAMLEKLTRIPDSLRALWGWSNGCEALFFRTGMADPEYPGDDFYSVEIAAQELAINRKEAGMKRHLIPFGGEEGSGDCLVLDTKSGRVHYWNHEQGDVEPEPVAGSLEELVSRVLPDSEPLLGSFPPSSDRSQAHRVFHQRRRVRGRRADSPSRVTSTRASLPDVAMGKRLPKEAKEFKSLLRDGKDTIARADLGKLLASLGTPHHLAAANSVIDYLKMYRLDGPPADRVSWGEFEAWLESDKPDE